mmetsp:Transcript_15600/g.39563  ORF Transcript_15600/g.39563 Transcript_15600/m.39563 type:complete len:114 (+) Transcript_15600:1208-1549(+)
MSGLNLVDSWKQTKSQSRILEEERRRKTQEVTCQKMTKISYGKKLVKGSWGLAKDKVSKAVVLERVQSYEEAFNRIQASTGIADIDELVTSFIEVRKLTSNSFCTTSLLRLQH